MTVRRMQKKHGSQKCSWCEQRATMRGFMWGKLSCPEHITELQEWDRRAQAPDYSDAAFYGGF